MTKNFLQKNEVRGFLNTLECLRAKVRRVLRQIQGKTYS